MQDYDDFKVGDDVWCIWYGRGKVVAVHGKEGYTYPVLVHFESGVQVWYTHTGKEEEACNRTLFFSEPKIEASVKRPFKPQLIGKRLIVIPKCDKIPRIIDEVVAEDEFKLYINSSMGYWPKIDLLAVYELGSENFLKRNETIPV